MKAAVIALGALVVILAFALYQRGASASRTLDAVLKDHHTASNQVAEFRTKLTLAQVTASQTASNLQRQLDRRAGDLQVTSNRLVQTHLLLQAAQKEARHAQEQLQQRAAQIATLNSDLAELRDRAQRADPAAATARERDLLRRELAEVSREREALQARVGALSVDKETLQTQLLDVAFLERQLKDAEAAADIRRRLASARSGAAPDPRQKLVLQTDGTVRYAAP